MKKPKSAKPRKSVAKPRINTGAGVSGCTFGVQFGWLASPRGYVQAWIPREVYDLAVASLLKNARDDSQRKMLRQRLAPLAVRPVCTGSCEGGFCGLTVIEEDDTGGSYACECKYWV